MKINSILILLLSLLIGRCGSPKPDDPGTEGNNTGVKFMAEKKEAFNVTEVMDEYFIEAPLPAGAQYSVISDRTGFVGDNFPNIVGIIVKMVERKDNWAEYEYYSGNRYLFNQVKVNLEVPSEDIPQSNVLTINSDNSNEVGFLGLNFGKGKLEAYELISDCIRRASIIQDSIDFNSAIEKVKTDIDFIQHPERFGIVFSASLYRYSTRIGSKITNTANGKIGIPLGASLFEIGGNSYKCTESKSFKNEYKILVGVLPIK